MLIHERQARAGQPFRLSGSNFRASHIPFFSQYCKRRHSVCSKTNQMKMVANQEDVFGQRSNHRARS